MTEDCENCEDALAVILTNSGISLSEKELEALKKGETVELTADSMRGKGRINLGCYNQGELTCCAYIEPGWPPTVVHECEEAKEANGKEPAPWYKWRSKLTGKTTCQQVSPGEGWEKADGPYKDSHCKIKIKKEGE